MLLCPSPPRGRDAQCDPALLPLSLLLTAPYMPAQNQALPVEHEHTSPRGDGTQAETYITSCTRERPTPKPEQRGERV